MTESVELNSDTLVNRSRKARGGIRRIPEKFRALLAEKMGNMRLSMFSHRNRHSIHLYRRLRLLPTLPISNQRGQSLVQILLSVGIMGIVLLAMASSQVMQHRENKALMEKLASVDLTRVITGCFGSIDSKTQLCTYQRSGP